MKHVILSVLLVAIFFSCKDKTQNSAEQQANNIQEMVKKNSPGTTPTTADGFMMTAKIDGKEWNAAAMYPPDRAGQVAGENNGESITLPYYDRRSFLHIQDEKKRKLGDGGDAAELRLHDDIALYSAVKGEMELTKVNDQMAEGKFSFTAKGFQSDKTIEVSDGFFRVLWK